MVCKEEVCSWFIELNGSKRVDLMCGLLNMCLPLELRFFGTCLEELGRKDFYHFRDVEQKANNEKDIKDLSIHNIRDNVTRSKLIVYLAMLNSSNPACSNTFYKILTGFKRETLIDLVSNEEVAGEILLLLTMAVHHPAFTFEQKSVLADQLAWVEKVVGNEVNEFQSTKKLPVNPLSSAISTVCNANTSVPTAVSLASSVTHLMPAETVALAKNITTVVTSTCPLVYPERFKPDHCPRARISNLEVKGVHNRKSYRIQVTWARKTTEILKTNQEMFNFHQKLLQHLYQDFTLSEGRRNAPQLPGYCSSNHHEITDEMATEMAEYLRQVVFKMPIALLESEFMLNFFQVASNNPQSNTQISNQVSGNFKGQVNTHDNSRLRSFTVYNSHMSDSPSHSSTDGRHCSPSSANSVSQQQKQLGSDINRTLNRVQPPAQSSPTTSPLSSPKSSPYVSPPHSGTSSRSASPWTSRISLAGDRGSSSTGMDSNDIQSLEQLLKKEGLRKYIQNLRGYTIEKLQNLNELDLKGIGLTMGAARKLKKALYGFSASVSNNQCSHGAPAGPTFPHPNSESSPSCSVDSSPSPSPPSLEACRLRSPTSSSSEESLPSKGHPVQKSDNARNVEGVSKTSNSPYNRAQQGGFHSKHNKKPAEKDDCYLNGREGGDSLKNVTNYGMTVPFLFPSPDIHPPKPNSLPLFTRAAATPTHIGAGTIIIENSQINRNHLAFLPSNPPHRSHNSTPERTVNPPVSFSGGLTFYQFPLITSGGASVTTTARSFVTYLGHSSVTVTTVGSGKFGSKTVDTTNTKQVPDPMPNVYHLSPCVVPPPNPGAAVQSNGAVISTASVNTSTVASSTVTTSLNNTPASIHTPPPPPTSLPYTYFLPHFLPQAFPFVAAHNNSPANGFVSPNLHVPPPNPNFPFHLPNGMNAAVSPEMVYPPQGFPLPSPSGPPPPTPSVTPYLGYLGSGSSYPHNQSVPLPALSKPVTCYNCGAIGHRGNECKSATLDEMTKSGHFRLHFTPSAKTTESSA
ncbi:zinc finger CCHC domain-containing protein 2-like isoform X2 [Limulus polyphemus]|uniref:Zinc finger CCHC domain-containing protein 2-like isoform X2 n=1 Tax=Limulus polyphemus TaxID=6850 RepID=A0ABM1SVD9_LIMPO|nr:zinc finger CCHC domain-containing protein 2-like isoform X2 [Limulus polyphemus]